MSCAEIQTNLAAFVLNGLEPEEAEEVRRHLASCPVCQDEVRELRKVNRALKAAPPPAEPPSRLKEEILAQVHDQQRYLSARAESSVVYEEASSTRFRSKHVRIVLSSAVAAVVAVVAIGIYVGFPREEPPVATIQLVPSPEEAAVLKGYWGVAEMRPQPSGNQQVELKLNNFEEPEPNSYYELWFVSGESRISAGSFTSVGKGETRVLLNAPPETRNYPKLVITEEQIGDQPASSEEVALKGKVP